MKTIHSTQNNEIKQIAQLIHAKERTRTGLFTVQGLRAITSFITAGKKPLMLYATDRMIAHAQKLVEDRYLTLVSDAVIDKISFTKTPSGIVGLFAIPPTPSPDLLSPGIVLADIADPGNMGTLIRSCAAFGKKTVVIIEGVDVWSPKVVMASAGTIPLVNIFLFSWQELLEHKKKLPLYALMPTGGESPNPELLAVSLIVIGNEAHGIPSMWANSCDRQITLPMRGKAESLNAAVAGAIALYICQDFQ